MGFKGENSEAARLLGSGLAHAQSQFGRVGEHGVSLTSCKGRGNYEKGSDARSKQQKVKKKLSKES